MNNFEKRLFLDYLDKLLPSINTRDYDFDDLLDFFFREFKTSKKGFNFDTDGVIQLETIRQQNEFRKKFKITLKKLKDTIPYKKTSLENKLKIIKEIYNLEDDEYQTFIFLLIKNINNIFNLLDGCIKSNSFDKFAKHYLRIRLAQKDRVINKLYQRKLIISKNNDPNINSDILKIFDNTKFNNMDKITHMLVGKPQKSTLTLKDFSHIEKEANKAISIVKSAIEKKAKGINILLHGSVGCGKTEFSKLIANSISVPIYEVSTQDKHNEEAKREDRLADLCSKQYILSRSNNSCILFDEAEDVLNRGFGSNGTSSKGYMNKLLEQNPVPVIWTTNNIYDVDPAFLRRMTYAIEFEKLSEAVRLNIWNKVLKKNKLKVPKSKIEELNKSYDVSPSIISNAVQTTKMINGNYDDFEDLIENVARVVNKKKVVKKENKENKFTTYDINLVNTDMDMKDLTDKIQKSGKLNFSLCLYGEPGTGKSLYARYLADILGIEVILKRASDLISPYVGQTEQNIAEAFLEAKTKKAMLIFDEADTFLQDRNNAIRSWEVAQVNEMLTQMESAEFPFVCTTNLLDTLDEASLRRFTFKIKFDFLTAKQVNQAMEHFFNFKDINLNIKGLTAGDFATVKKKADFLNISDLKELTKMLSDEVKIKKSTELKNTIGF